MNHISVAVAAFIQQKLPNWVLGENMFVQNSPDITPPILSVISDPSLIHGDGSVDALNYGEVTVILRTNDLEGSYDDAMQLYKLVRVTEPFESSGHRITQLRPKRPPIDYPTSGANIVEVSITFSIRFFVTGW